MEWKHGEKKNLNLLGTKLAILPGENQLQNTHEAFGPVPDTHEAFGPVPDTHEAFGPVPDTHEAFGPVPDTHEAFGPVPDTHEAFGPDFNQFPSLHMATRVAKPQLRGLLSSQIKRDFLQAVAFTTVTCLAWRYLVQIPRKNRVHEFQKNLDVEADFERKVRAGVFQCVSPDGKIKSAKNY
ncbi:hypothetical protein CHS0354_027623 [Potamilus streckersoni]|uniref:Uncharacterized protein n=1 Tax=Potamilus streckersoni TaxID=2493646 RepID=A0AAE0T1C9_9BIVA|nr:hypothetical protein CHS0354_027623 [Potamilus streckersoni]